MNIDLIQQFHQNAKVHLEMDYADKISVKNGNKSVNKLYEIAEKPKKYGDTNQLIGLLKVKEYKVDLWAAHILLERFDLEGQIADKALDVINQYANSNDPGAFGEKLWLEHWKTTEK